MINSKPEGINPWVKNIMEFHEKFNHHVSHKGYRPNIDEITLRNNLLLEEVEECIFATIDGKRADILDALADIITVCIGTALVYGFDIDEAMHRVHESNMSKLGADGKPVYRADGKIGKGDNFVPPYLDDLV